MPFAYLSYSRCQVTLLALHQYLGLGAELIASRHRGDKNLKYNQEFLDEALMTDSQEEPTSLENSHIKAETPPTPSALALAMNPQQDAGLAPYSLHKQRRRGSMEKREQMMVFALRSFREQLGLESEASLEGSR